MPHRLHALPWAARLGAATAEERWLAAARQELRYDRSLFSLELGMWRDLRRLATAPEIEQDLDLAAAERDAAVQRRVAPNVLGVHVRAARHEPACQLVGALPEVQRGILAIAAPRIRDTSCQRARDLGEVPAL